METFPQQEANSVLSSIATVRNAWLEALRSSDAERLGSLVTDDIVVVHGNGRCVHGREELIQDFRKGFEAFSIDQTVANSELVIRDDWAFEISEVESRLTPHREGEITHVHSITVVALSRQRDGSWKVRRVLGVLPLPLAGLT